MLLFSHISVITPEQLVARNPDALLVLPWNLIDELRKHDGPEVGDGDPRASALGPRSPKPTSVEELIHALGSVHVEFILMHPFREGNGRIARLLTDVMAVQADVGPLDYSSWDINSEAYFSAVRTGIYGDLAPIQILFRQALPGAV